MEELECQNRSFTGIISTFEVTNLLLIFLSLSLVTDDKETGWSKNGGRGGEEGGAGPGQDELQQ